MNRYRRVTAGLLAFVLAGNPSTATESTVQQAVQVIRNEWEQVFYQMPADQQGPRLEALLARSKRLVQHHPKAAEPLIMEALVFCAMAGHDGGFSALGYVKQARESLLQAIKLDPHAMEGSALVILGNLYYRLPGWPISFGDDDRAREYLQMALKLFPDRLDTNYFYGDFLLEQGDFKNALTYLERAEKAAVRPDSQQSDIKLKQELNQALQDARERNAARASFFSRFLSSFSKEPSRP